MASSDRLVTSLFCLECLFIMAGYGKQFWLYFLGLRVGKWESHAKWNCFDFIVSFTSLAFLNEEGSSTVACLRLLRLSKILKAIFAHEPGFVVIMEGLKKGMSSISYIITLLLFVLFLYGSVGVSLFGDNGTSKQKAIRCIFMIQTSNLTLNVAYLPLSCRSCTLWGHSDFNVGALYVRHTFQL